MSLGDSSSSGSAPTPPEIFPVDALATEQAGINADTYGYNQSDTDFAARFPGLVAGRTGDINQAYKELTGPIAPEVSNQFVESGLAKAFGAFGGGSESANVTSPGSIGRKTVAASVANDTQGYQDSARSYFEQLLGQNPPRAFGLSGGDMLNMAILNEGNLSNANTQARQLQDQFNAAQSASSQSGTNALIGVGGSLLASAAPALIGL